MVAISAARQAFMVLLPSRHIIGLSVAVRLKSGVADRVTGLSKGSISVLASVQLATPLCCGEVETWATRKSQQLAGSPYD